MMARIKTVPAPADIIGVTPNHSRALGSSTMTARAKRDASEELGGRGRRSPTNEWSESAEGVSETEGKQRSSTQGRVWRMQ